MRKTLLFTLILGLLTIWGCTRKSKSEITYTSISMEEAKGRLETEKGYILVDVRTPEEYSEGQDRDPVTHRLSAVRGNVL